MLAYSILLLILQKSLSLAGRFSPAVSMCVMLRWTLTAGPQQWADSSSCSSCLPAAEWGLRLADGCRYFVDVGLSSGTSRGGKQVGELKLK